jgi:hypothetical protein
MSDTKPTKPLDQKTAVSIASAGAVGGVLAIAADIMQKENASAVGKLAESFSVVLHKAVPPLLIMFLLMVFAVALCFIFEARSTKRALYTGASILSIIMTLVPYKTPDSLTSHPKEPAAEGHLREGQTNLAWWNDMFTPGTVFAQTPQQPATAFLVTVHLAPDDKKEISAAIFSLVDPKTGQVVARSKVAGSDFNFYVSRPYVLNTEVPGYAIAKTGLDGTHAQQVTVLLHPSHTPLALQHLFRY